MDARGRIEVTRRPRKSTRVSVADGGGGPGEGSGVPLAAAIAAAASMSATRAARDRTYGLVNQWTRPESDREKRRETA
jgi:hypothetical protein